MDTHITKVHITKKFQCEINKDLKQTCMTLFTLEKNYKDNCYFASDK